MQSFLFHIFIAILLCYGVGWWYIENISGDLCKKYNSIVEENTREEFESMSKCVYMPLCEIGEIKRYPIHKPEQGINTVIKEFTCVMKF